MSYLNTTQQNLGLVKIKSICRNKIIVTSKLKFVLGMVENISGNEENGSAACPGDSVVSMSDS